MKRINSIIRAREVTTATAHIRQSFRGVQQASHRPGEIAGIVRVDGNSTTISLGKASNLRLIRGDSQQWPARRQNGIDLAGYHPAFQTSLDRDPMHIARRHHLRNLVSGTKRHESYV